MDDASDDQRWMAEALVEAARGLARGELPIGAVVVAGGRIVGRAHTQERAQRRLLVHAELLALDEADRTAGWDRAGSTLYTTLEPCLMCLGAAATAMVGRVVYALPADSDGAGRLAQRWEAERADGLDHVRLPHLVGGIGEAESHELVARFVAEHGSSPSPLVTWAQSLLTSGATPPAAP